MNSFTSVNDVSSTEELAQKAIALKYNPLANSSLGKGKSICLIFFNSSLRTRMSTATAAQNLGLNVSAFNVSEDGWNLEFEDGAVMDQGNAEHVKEAAAVLGSYFDIIGIRSFANLLSEADDYEETVLNQFMKYANKPIVSLESSTLHPLQSLADLITIRENSRNTIPKVVLSWAPHPRALPHAVPNSFSEWMLNSEVDLTIVQPEGFELKEKYTKGARVMYDQEKAFEGADFIYAKNWSSLTPYGQKKGLPNWMITEELMKQTNNAKFMHCLPVRRNVVVTDSVLDGPNSLVIEQASNRIPAAQAVLKSILEG